MKDLYLYNEGSHTLHINGFCRDANGKSLLPFATENDALAYAGRAMGMCKTCLERREQRLSKMVTEEKITNG